MSITFFCDQCGESYEVENALAGKAVRCRNCNDLGRVPQAKTLPKKEAAPIPTSQKLTLPTIPTQPEPWYYRFLDTLAGVYDFAQYHWLDRVLYRVEGRVCQSVL